MGSFRQKNARAARKNGNGEALEGFLAGRGGFVRILWVVAMARMNRRALRELQQAGTVQGSGKARRGRCEARSGERRAWRPPFWFPHLVLRFMDEIVR